MVLQSLAGEKAIEILSMIVRFHLMSDCRLAGLPRDKFDPHINTSHQLDCLKDLLILQADAGVGPAAGEEMAALYLLTNLTATEARLWSLDLADGLRSRPLVSAALQLAAAAAEHNYVRFFRLLHKSRLTAPFRLAVRRTAGRLVVHCLRVMNTAYSSPACRYPLEHLAGLLRLQPAILRTSCAAAGVRVAEGSSADCCHIQFSKSTSLNLVEEEGRQWWPGQDGECLTKEEWRSYLLRGLT